MLNAIEVIEPGEPPLVIYCEKENDKYIAVMIDDRVPEEARYILYPVKDINEFTVWEDFRETHTAKQRVNLTQIHTPIV